MFSLQLNTQMINVKNFYSTSKKDLKLQNNLNAVQKQKNTKIQNK